MTDGTPRKRRNRKATPVSVDGKGRTVLPARIRDGLGLFDNGGFVTFELDGDRAIIRRASNDLSKGKEGEKSGLQVSRTTHRDAKSST